ncbi:MAG: AMP-binding protein [Chitinophagales bacterium]
MAAALKTLIESFYDKEKNVPNKPFLRQPFGDKWEVYTYGEVGQMARKLATGLKSLGLPPKSHIGLVSKNCREWIIADLAIMMADYISVPFFPTLSGEQIAEVLKLGDVAALFVGKLDVWDDMKTGVPADMPMIRFPHYKGGSKVEVGEDWNEFMNRFEPIEGEPSAKLDDLWTIIFTSGTTGTPKGVMLPYRAPSELMEAAKVRNVLKLDFNGDNDFFSYLPLNHIAERAIVEGGCLAFGGQISFSESLATFAKNLQESYPTTFFAVPRIWTKFHLSILAKMPQKKLDLLLKIPIISGIIKKKLKAGLGLSKARVCVSGAAPIPQSLKDWYAKIGVPIAEGYGMTENCAACTFLTTDENKPGSVGKPQDKVEVRIDPETEEVLMRAPYVMTGYYKSPDKTAETLENGWLHTGDQGRIDKDGYLYLTGRVKDTFKTAKGEFIVPAPIEWGFENNSDIEQLCLLGLGLPQPVLLVVPSEIGVTKSRQELRRSLADTLIEVNKGLESYCRVSTIVVVQDAFSVENGMLTPTLKVKRSKLNQRYKDLLLAWHEHKEEVVWE